MAQLSDDCFAFGGELLRVDEAEQLIAARVSPLSRTETVALDDARGRGLAANLIAPVPLPTFDNSAVDGFAVRHGDLRADAPTRLAIGETVYAGSSPTSAVGAGIAIRIFTGAPMPTGADTVFMQEDCRIEDDAVVLPEGLARGANVRLAGEDIEKGAVALAAGRVIGVREAALAAALGVPRLTVRRRARVALFSTGDELVEPGEPLGSARTYDANRAMLAMLLRAHGAEVTDLGILADEPEGLARSLRRAADGHDLILTSGGVSAGDADFVRAAVERVGRLFFWRLAIKPGRPVALGVIGAGEENAAFVGLPGNPVAVFVTFAHVVRPLLLRLAGATPMPLATYPVRAAFAYKKKAGRREYVRVALREGDDGIPEATKHPKDGAGIITSLTRTDGLAVLPEEMTRVEPGTMLRFTPHSAMTGFG